MSTHYDRSPYPLLPIIMVNQFQMQPFFVKSIGNIHC